MFTKNIFEITSLAIFLLSASTSYAVGNFTCPQPTEIESTDFTAPSIWLAPPVLHSVPGQVGVGLGGKKAVKLLGVESAAVKNKEGWVCVYKSEGGTSVNDYETKIKNIVAGNKYLNKHLGKINKFFEDAQPYLKNYPKDEPLGFIGYQLEEQNQGQKKR